MSDPFSKATSSFLNNDDLEGRGILVRPDELGTRKSKTKPDETYEYVVCDVVVLNGEVTDKIEDVPGLLDAIQLTGGGVVASIKGLIGKRDTEGRRKLKLGRISKVKSQVRGQNDAWILGEPTDEDVTEARAYLKANPGILMLGVSEDDAFA